MGGPALAGAVTWFLYYQTIDTYWYSRMRDLPLSATEEEVMAANGDGAPKLFALLCGWLPVGIYVACWMGLRLLIARLRQSKVWIRSSESPRRSLGGHGHFRR